MTDPRDRAESCAKGYTDGTHRLISPAATVERLRPLMPVLGITRLADITGLDHLGLPVFSAYRPNSRSLAVSQGKGLHADSARASALMEATELFHAERITRPLKFASWLDLFGDHSVVDIEALPRLSIRRFRRDEKILWIEGTDLASGGGVWLPFDLVHTDFSLPLPPGSGCFPITSNGLASGNHRLEAISHGICEVVERDAHTVWLMLDEAARAATRIDLTSVDDPTICQLLERLDHAGAVAAAWDLTCDTGLPVFRCELAEAHDSARRQLYIGGGMGCHTHRELALLRALTEAAQVRLTKIAGARDDLSRIRLGRARDSEAFERWHREMAAEPACRPFDATPTYPDATVDGDTQTQCRLLAAAGFQQVLVVDLTHPGLRIPVVRVVIPGLEASREVPGYLPGARARGLRRRPEVIP